MSKFSAMCVLLALVTAACSTGPGAGDPTSANSASTPAFPDFGGYTPVDAKAYFQSRPYFGGIMFSTPDGLSCDHNAMNSLNDPNVVSLTCTGPRPDQGPGNWKVRVTTDRAATVDRASNNPPEGGPYPLVPARHTITYEGIFCGVDADGTTACRIGGHGFVLTATETKLF